MDIIILAALAIFIFLRLKSQLGQISDEEKESITKKIKSQREQLLKAQVQAEKDTFLNQHKLNGKANDTSNEVDKKYTKHLDQKSIDALNQTLQSLNISAEFFIQGSKTAFEMVLKSFAKSDVKTLELLLSEKLCSGFKKSIDSRKKEDKTLHTEIISIDEGQILAANINKDKALITVQFLSNQINYLTDKKNKIIQGSKEQINELKDVWTFKKDLKDESPNWIVSTTG